MGGKTSLARTLAARLGMHSITHSRPTEAARLLGHTQASAVPAWDMVTFQWLGLMAQVAAERAAWEEFEGYVADRAVMDFVGYYMAQVPPGHRDSITVGGDPFLDLPYVRAAQAYAQAYDLILVCPPLSQAPTANGMRHVSDPWVIHQELLAALGAMNLTSKIHVIQTDGPEARTDEVLEVLRERRLL